MGLNTDPKEAKTSKVLEITEDNEGAAEIAAQVSFLLAESKTLKTYQVLVSGITIQICLDTPTMHKDIAELLLKAESVVIYRASPG